MTILIVSLVVAALLPYLAKVPVAVAMQKSGGYDNHHPREQQARLSGAGARALAGHHNAFESLIVFAAAILLAIATGTTGTVIQGLAVAHIGFRVAYHVLYLLDIAAMRSIAWTFAIGCSLAIMLMCI